jgi:NitT/TauT family transport system substrate-binding protein
MKINTLIAASLMSVGGFAAHAQAEAIRIAVGTTDAVITTSAGGAVVRELKLLEKYLPHDGKYKDATYDIEWKNFTSGAPITNEMVAGRLDFGIMAEFPGVLNRIALEKAGRESFFVAALSGSIRGAGNGIVVPSGSPIQSVSDLKGKTISVPFASAAHGLLLRVVEAQGWTPDKEVKIITQAPEVAGAALQSGQIEAHADFVPYPELFPFRGYARKIYDGSQSNAATFHGLITTGDFAQKYPEVLVAYLKAVIEAEQLISKEPEKYSELIEKVSGVNAEVNYLFFGPLGLQSRHLAFKPEYHKAEKLALATLKLLKRADQDTDTDKLLNEQFIRQAFKELGLDYDDRLKNYDQLSLNAKDATTGEDIKDPLRVAEIWVKGEPLVRHYATTEGALKAFKNIESEGKTIRVFYAQDRENGIKLFGNQAWFVHSNSGEVSAFLLKEQAETWAKANGGKVVDFSGARSAVLASN